VFQPNPFPPTERVIELHDPIAARDRKCKLGLESN